MGGGDMIHGGPAAPGTGSFGPAAPGAVGLDPDELRGTAGAVLDELARFLAGSRSGGRPVVSTAPIEEVEKLLDLGRWTRDGGMDDTGLLRFLRAYLDHAAAYHHPGYLAHQIAPSDTPGVVADLVQSVLNNAPLIYELTPPGAAVDRAAWRWMLERAGWGASGTGTLTHGGSLGNLIALVAARSRADTGSWRRGNGGRLVVLAAPSGHYSLRKAAAVMGLGADGVLPLPVDRLGRIRVDRVPEAIAAARRGGGRPIALVANACATGTGLYDDLAGLAEVCGEHGVWLHVDGAHGASALVSDRHRRLMAGLEGADSLTWDAHKMLRAPVLTTGVLFRDRASFDGLFEQDASYLFEERMRDLDPGQRTFETTKPPIGLRIVLALAMRGERGLAAYVDRQYALAHRAWEVLRETPGFELPYEPESNVLCFRYAPAGDRQLDLRRLVNEDGAFYLSSVRIGEKAHLRAAFMSPTTTEQDVVALGATIGRLAAALEDGGGHP